MLVDTCYTEEEVRRQKDEQVRQQNKMARSTFFTQFRGIVRSKSFCPVSRDCQSDGEDGPGLELPQLPHHQVGSNLSPTIFFVKREYLERQAKAEAFKAGEEIDEAIKTVQNAGEKLKATAEEAKSSLEAKTGSNNGGAGLVPSIWMLVLLPRMMM